MLTSLFITGTNTNVGKTIATRALLQSLNDNSSSAIGYKPIIKTKFQETSVVDEINKFTSTISQSSPISLTANEINPVIIQNSHEKELVIDFNQINKKITILKQKANYIAKRLNFDYIICFKNRSSRLQPISIFLRFA